MGGGSPTQSSADQFALAGRVALVTGGSKGIGLATATLLTEAGAQVAVASRDAGHLDAAVEEIVRACPGAEPGRYVVNAGEASQAEATVQAVLEDFGRIDILVNNAATNPYYGPVTGIDVARAAKTVQVNLIGPVFWTRYVCDAWMSAHGGAIVNMASLGAYIVEPGAGFYAVTKAGLVHLTTQLAAELGPAVRVNAIAPGVVKTDMARVLWEGREKQLAARLPLRRLGVPRDIANTVLFLVSDASSWMTGQTLVVDGGAMAMPLAGLGEQL
ncbi:3-oxoacyl-ACP reductase [Prauserella sp. PE36]|uniref:SDR family oxidoreductase n=1 Tax=Prauserella sp. PE36 TaxID=1504709 RepID=UPI000DE27EA4|nr:SDR family oxidoreductase [Prauserella sp. PE36]RBM18813.1 3-oxoacyl-ACP reductase [Prauserella sp. PE36]